MIFPRPCRFIGEEVRYFRYSQGWMFGTVHSIRVLDGFELATVFFPGRDGFQGYPSETTEIAGFLLERCGVSLCEDDIHAYY